MRILHTSDWHLGRAFHGVGMLDHQAAYLDHLVETIESERVDLVVVSGDVFDRGLPPAPAIQLADETFHRLAASRARVVVSSGNHDSASRLGLHARLIDTAGVHFRTVADGLATPVLVPDEHGVVAVYAIPYLEPDLLTRAWELPTRSHQAVLGEAMRRIRADLSGRDARSVVLAHAFVAGAEPSDSERDITVGGVSRVSVDTFDGVDYAALGHLHGRATLADNIRYSGSPLAYSFSEADHVKGSWLVDLGPAGVRSTEFIEAPVPRPLARLTGTIEELLESTAHAVAEGAWVHATLTDPVRPMQAMERLRRRFPHTLGLAFTGSSGLPADRRLPVSGRSDRDVVVDFVEAVRGVPATAAEAALLTDAVDSCCHDSDADRLVARP